MGIYGDPKKKVRGPSDFFFRACVTVLLAIFLGGIFLMYKAFYP